MLKVLKEIKYYNLDDEIEVYFLFKRIKKEILEQRYFDKDLDKIVDEMDLNALLKYVHDRKFTWTFFRKIAAMF